MRFIENGPSIPDELLIARDQGRVVFFCGSGVSKAKADLPDFFGLVEAVAKRLGVHAEHAVFKTLTAAREIEDQTTVPGLISADRIFGLLEREYTVHDIHSAVAEALKPASSPCLDAHNIILDLATTREGIVRIVTTNFDLLFDDCGRNVKAWHPPQLPNPANGWEMGGIVYLHGKVTTDYSKSEGDEFVLSSSEFGKAYLAEGWATAFVRDILEKYVVVFVGYSADDPPIHYLLEALNKSVGKTNRVYAFQNGSMEKADSRWLHKGVKAIPFENYETLWETLSAWSFRAKDPDAWYKEVIEKSRSGPEKLSPYERGQIAHIVSTDEGAKRFANGDDVSPASWLCVFDPRRRYGKPGYTGDFVDRGDYIDPFDLYCIDTDDPPAKIHPDHTNGKREIPKNAWSAFALNSLDRTNLGEESFSSFGGYYSAKPARLAKRLEHLGIWLAKVSNQVDAVWWAAHQSSIHSEIVEKIERQLVRMEPTNGKILQAWSLLIESWKTNEFSSSHGIYNIQESILKHGWSTSTLRKYAAQCRPRLKVMQSIYSRPTPPPSDEQLNISWLINAEVEYQELASEIEIPDAWLAVAIRDLRKNLEIAIELEVSIGGIALYDLAPISVDEAITDNYHRSHGISGAVIAFANLFKRLIDTDTGLAKIEMASWPAIGDPVFDRLRVWTASSVDVVSDDNFIKLISELSDDFFWSHHHERDLFISLLQRWNKLPKDSRIRLEDRILRGPVQNENEKKYEERSAWIIASRLAWLKEHKCTLELNFDDELDRLKKVIPDWTSQEATSVAASHEMNGGMVRTETEHSELLKEPLNSIIQSSRLLSGRKTGNIIVEQDPFRGLSESFPVRALSALRIESTCNSFPQREWRTYLSEEKRKSDKPRLMWLIAERLKTYDESDIATIINPVSGWLLNVSQILSAQPTEIFDQLIQKLIRTIGLHPENCGTAIIRRPGSASEWVTEGLNSPAGKIVRGLFKDIRVNQEGGVDTLPDAWKLHVEVLLSLPEPMYQHSLVLLTYHLGWLHAMDSEWTEKYILKILESNNLDAIDAFWTGFFWKAKVPSVDLYKRLSPFMLARSRKEASFKSRHEDALPGMLMAGWATTEDGRRLISDEELREVLLNAEEKFREKALWQLSRWVQESREENIWPKLIVQLLKNVWPRQISIKTPATSARLCDLAFACEESFPEVTSAIIPLLSEASCEYIAFPNLLKANGSVIDKYPEESLALLYAVLPESTKAWPYKIEDALDRMEIADPALHSDVRMIELRRRWDSR